MDRIEALRALLAQTAETEQALQAEEYDRFAELVTARGQAMVVLGADGPVGAGLSELKAAEVGDLLRALQAADERLVAQVALRLGDTRAEISQQRLATSTVSAYRNSNRRVAPQFASRFVDEHK